MKSILLIFILLGLIFIGGCSKPEEDPKAGKMSAEQIFEKKQECAKYIDDIQTDIDKNNEIFSQNESYYESLTEIFYSESKNSCFALIDIKKQTTGKLIKSKKIIDLLTAKQTIFEEGDLNNYYAALNFLEGK